MHVCVFCSDHECNIIILKTIFDVKTVLMIRQPNQNKKFVSCLVNYNLGLLSTYKTTCEQVHTNIFLCQMAI